jgi:CheY-like chemotaxis protein
MSIERNDDASLSSRLRRYTRALSGNSHVAALLAREAAKVAADDAGGSDRDAAIMANYRVIGRLWRSLGELRGPRARDMPPGALPEQRRVARMSPDAREAFLLTAMEGFTQREAAAIIGVSEAAIVSLVAAAKADGGGADAARIVIIEDEFLIAKDLEQIVVDLGHRVIARARTRAAASASIRGCRPDLILADIQLADDSSGIDAVNDVLHVLGGVPIVFITAFPARLISEHRPAPTFLVGKPYDPCEVRAAVTQILYFGTRSRLTSPCSKDDAGPPLVRFGG